jgi:hypothetical protein
VAFCSNSFAGDLPYLDEPTLGRYDLTRASAFECLFYYPLKETMPDISKYTLKEALRT